MLAARKFFCLLPQQSDNGQTTERASFMCGQQTTVTTTKTTITITANGLVNFLIYFPAELHSGSV